MSTPVSAVQRELVRFAVVGVVVAAVYFALFLFLVQALLSEIAANTVAFCTAVVLQYALQSKWTFGKDMANPAQIRKFLGTVGLGFLLSGAISGVLAPAWNWPPKVTALVVIVTLPISNFVLFKLWVFARN